MLEMGMPIDDIVFIDTSIEFPSMYEHIDKVEQYIKRSITRLKAEHSYEYLLLTSPPLGIKKKQEGKQGIGFPMGRTRWCTTELKTKVIKQYFKQFKILFNILV